MRRDVWIILGAGAAVFALAAYIFAYATTPAPTVAWQDGDIIIQTAKTGPAKAILGVAKTPYTQIGLVEVTPDGPVVIEAGEKDKDKVRETPLKKFIEESSNERFAVYRVNDLTPERAAEVLNTARRYLGRPFDSYFRKTDLEIYGAELVQTSFAAVDVELGEFVKIERLAKDMSPVKSFFDRRWSDHPDCKLRSYNYLSCWRFFMNQPIVTPASIAADTDLTLLYSTL